MSNETRTIPAGVADATPWYRLLAAWLLAAGTRTTNRLVYSTLYLVAIAMLETALVIAALDLPMSVAPLVVGLLTFSVYAGDRLADVDTDAVSNPGQSAFVRRHRTALSVLTAAAYGLAITISVTGGPLALALALLPGGFWILYASDWLPRLGNYVTRLKDVLVVNSLLVAVAWAITLTFVPLAFVDAPLSVGAVGVFAYFVLDRFINTEIPNLKDAAGDAAIGVSTLPVVFGERRTRHILYALSLAIGALLAGAYVTDVVTAAIAVAFGIGVVYTLVLTAAIGRTENHARLAIASECKHVLVFAVLVAFTGFPL